MAEIELVPSRDMDNNQFPITRFRKCSICKMEIPEVINSEQELIEFEKSKIKHKDYKSTKKKILNNFPITKFLKCNICKREIPVVINNEEGSKKFEGYRIEHRKYEHVNCEGILEEPEDEDVTCEGIFEPKKTKEKIKDKTKDKTIKDKTKDKTKEKDVELKEKEEKNRKKYSINDVIGADEAKKILKQHLIYRQKYREDILKLGNKMNLSRGIVLCGPPGTGKTMLVLAIMNEPEFNEYVMYIELQIHDFAASTVSDSSEKIDEFFINIHKISEDTGKMVVLVIDEMELLFNKRHAGGILSKERTTTLLSHIGGLLDRDTNMLIIGTTNRPYDIDPAVLRSGRLDELILIDSPTEEDRALLAKRYFDIVPLDQKIDFKIIAKNTPDYTGADFAKIGEKLFFEYKTNKESKGEIFSPEEIVQFVDVHMGQRKKTAEKIRNFMKRFKSENGSEYDKDKKKNDENEIYEYAEESEEYIMKKRSKIYGSGKLSPGL